MKKTGIMNHATVTRRVELGIRNAEGAILVVALIFLSVLSVIGISFASLVIQQSRLAQVRIAEEYGFHIAEAGLNYARWRLAHNQNDFSSVTRVVDDPQGGVVGSYTVIFNGSSSIVTGTIRIDVDGWYQDNTNLKRIVSARYGRRGFTQYAFLTNANIYFSGGNWDGRIHTNGGDRMDAEANSVVSSAVATYDFGTTTPTCVDTDNIKDGIWRCDGTTRPLWEYPVSNVDFNAVTGDLAVLKAYAECFGDIGCSTYLGNGKYFAAQGKGYHLIFDADGTVDIYEVNSTPPTVWNWSFDDGWSKKSTEINSESLAETYTLQGEDLLFFEDDVWVEGTVDGRVTVIAAQLPSIPGADPDIILRGDLIYEDKNGDDVLGLIAQSDVLVPLKPTNGSTVIPNTGSYEVDAALLAQTGRFYRYFYCHIPWWSAFGYKCSTQNDPYYNFGALTLYGSMISYNQPFNYWGNYGGYNMGVLSLTNIYDPQLVYTPPPYFPVSGDFELISWEEKEKGE